MDKGRGPQEGTDKSSSVRTQGDSTPQDKPKDQGKDYLGAIFIDKTMIVKDADVLFEEFEDKDKLAQILKECRDLYDSHNMPQPQFITIPIGELDDLPRYGPRS